MQTNVLIFFPMAGAIAVWIVPWGSRRAAGGFALLVALAELAFWVGTALNFDFGTVGLQAESERVWFSDLGVAYKVGLYDYSLWLVGLTAVVTTAAVAYGFWAGREREGAYLSLLLFLEGATVGVFAAQDLVLFYVFWEAMLIPIYVLIGVWGGAGRLGATVKFVIYTITGSLLMLVAILAAGLQAGTFDIAELTGQGTSTWIFLGFAIGFAVKAPVWPFHGWLPDAYRESTPEVAAVLSGLTSKTAAYGFLAIAIPLYPGPAEDWRVPVLVLASIGLVYGSLLAFRSPDVRGVIAYSSLAQMNLIVIGIFAANASGYTGALLQMVNHGLISTALFLLAGTIERRTSTGQLDLLGGMARGRPVLATILITTGVIALAVPGSTAFAAEFLVLNGVFAVGWGWAVVGAVAIVLAAMYMVRLISAVLHESPGSAVPAEALDLRPAEVGIITPLVAILLVLSFWPAAVTERVFGALF
ncbi:MAG TPA: NADH-quinone oxidoreductase subunit M [Gaiellaceae bacterium]|nr:NADH-quinone oxidoreductase subunit M [Gaiellaceae bacterium]